MLIKPTRTLILVVGQHRYDAQEFVDIANRVKARALDIQVFVVERRVAAKAVPDEAWQLPTLTVSLESVMQLKPRRGRVMISRRVPKLDQVTALQGAGIDVPHCAPFAIGMALDPAEWGELVLLKPEPTELSSKGEGTQLFRTAALARMTKASFPRTHLAHRAPMLVQRFIDTGPRPEKYRVLMFCGEVLYIQHTILDRERPPLDAPDEALQAAVVDTSGGERHYEHGSYPDVHAFAMRIGPVFSGIPLMGIDVIRDAATGKLYALEVNAGGNVWHFSSLIWAERREKFPQVAHAMHTQYGAFDMAAQALVQATRRLAL